MLTHRLVLMIATLVAAAGCTSVNLNPTTWETPKFTSTQAEVGTPAWWKQNQKKAEFVPGEGYRIAGIDGYFDQEGRPINAKVTKMVKHSETKGLFKDVGVSTAVEDFKNQVGLGPDEQQAKLAFAKGEDLFQREKYSEAAKAFEETIARWPESSLAQDATFLLGESHFFNHEYAKAIDSYDQLLADNPNSKHLDKVVRRQFDIARYWEQHHQGDPHWATTPNLFDDTRPLFDTLGNSLKVYENIRLNDPTGPLADDAIMATANSYFLRARYNDADYHYELLRTDYPRSEHQFEAHILGLQCKLRKYQGPDYDGTPLLEAKKLAKQIKVQFAGKLNEDEKKRLELDLATLQKQLADRDWKLAKYYEENGYNASAKFYYAKVIRNFSGTPIANEAQQSYAALEGLPEQPPVRLESIVKLLPENAERKAIADVPLLDEIRPDIGIASQPEPADGGDATILR
ncbi:MAG: outer membrane protein assembly factor BamD [Planctomycetota bacterium]